MGCLGVQIASSWVGRSCQAFDLRRPGSAHLQRQRLLTSNFAFALRTLLDQTSSSRPGVPRSMQSGFGPTNVVFQALELEYLQRRGAAGVTNTSCITPASDCFTPFIILFQLRHGNPQLCRQRALATSLTSATIVDCLGRFKPLALSWMFARAYVWNSFN